MTTRVTREYTIPYSKEKVWNVISNHSLRAEGLTVVNDYAVIDEEKGIVEWELTLNKRFLPSILTVETKEIERIENKKVVFRGKSKIFTVEGKHIIKEIDNNTVELQNIFIVDGKVPGVERFFKHKFDDEINNLVQTYREKLDH